MPLKPDVQLAVDGDANDKNDPLIDGSNTNALEPTEDESEDDDLDFNPLLKGSPSEEATSSLSSEVEVLDADVVNSHGGLPKLIGDCLGYTIANPKEDELTHDSHDGTSDGEHEKRDCVLISEQKDGTVQEKENGSSSGIDAVEDAPEAQITMNNSSKPIIDLDDDDAICKRTRARYSLTGFTLDELETFLQETDDDDDVHNIDEEEEYRRFLAAVLQGDDGDDQGNLEGNDDPDDEDNDADFELEIEEALESDIDDCVMTSNKDGEFEPSSRRPETRQNRRQKANGPNKKVTHQGKRPLRPLVPVMPSAPIAPHPSIGARYLTPENAPHYSLNGFMAHQIGQLYYLIYEHVQLLVQVYSLCVLEPSRQHIASQVKGLLSEMLHKRDLVLAWRNVRYPSSCFLPPYVYPSISDGNKKKLPSEDSGPSSQQNFGQGCRWLPDTGGPVLSVLDVAPLKLAERYLVDISSAVKEHQRRCVETTNIYLEKEPLFPFPSCPPVAEGDQTPPDLTTVIPNNKVPKKTLAATLVESTKKQSVALVPKQVAQLAQPFYSLFNPELFPHKPPPLAVANRVLFTDGEDELLALGMMEYNNNWKAIQQRFLPCKTEHQIFVRAKNRCSSKAPENPIKMVRKMKTSPLTEEEKARIHEGLKAFKLDWTSVWKTIVPYRDPNLLPRQWRIAIGTQKSYKADSNKKEKRRIYESNRRRSKVPTASSAPQTRSKIAAMEKSQTGPEEDNQTEYPGDQNENGEDCMNNNNEAYLHEAFLADWRPTSEIPALGLESGCLPGDLSAERFEVREEPDNHGNQESQSAKARTSEDSNQMCRKSFQPYIAPRYQASESTPKFFTCESLFHTQRTRKHGISNLVKLAPELPPVELPPAVRIIPQASLRSSQLELSTEVGNSNPNVTNMSSHKGGLLKNGCLSEERGTDLDPQMHPLLFRTLEEGHLPCYPLNNSTRVPTFSFFPGGQHHIDVRLVRNEHPASPSAATLKSSRSKETTPTPSSLDFHPLLQSTNDSNANSIDAGPSGPLLSTDLELSRDGFAEENDVFRANQLSANDLDLDIHLSSASRKRKVSSREGDEINGIVQSVSSTQVVEGDKESTDFHGKYPQLASFGACIIDNVGDQPLLEIVMEQEELSDSDEEMEDVVEFECEEMSDSEGEEGSNAEQIVNEKNQEQADGALDKDKQDQPSESVLCGPSEEIRGPRKGRTPRSNSTVPGKSSKRGSWLSLNSHGSQCTPKSRAKRGESSAEGIPGPSHSNKYCKKVMSKTRNISSDEQTTNISQIDHSPTLSRKSKKKPSKERESL